MLEATKRHHPGRLLPEGWLVQALFLLFPLWWVLGLGGFIWPVLAVGMLLSLTTRRERIRVPKGFGLWVLFLLWMLITVVRVDSFDRGLAFAYRATLYLSATVTCLYVYNAPRRLLPTRRVVNVLVGFWVIIVAGGFLGMIAPHTSLTTPFEMILPGRLLNNAFLKQLVHPGLASVQTFLGFPIPRPKAPFTYPNEWGSNYAVLLPFVLASLSELRTPRARNALRILIGASLLPVIFSMNRVLWVSIFAGLVYSAYLLGLRGQTRLLKLTVAVLVMGTLVFTLGPTGALIQDRLAHPHSNNGRATLYNETTDSALKSPVLGYGAPRPSQANPNLPSQGTQGQLWLVLFSHGFPALAFFLGWFGYALWRTRRAAAGIGLWCHVVIMLAFVQMPFYDALPATIHTVMIAIALAYRERTPSDEPELDPEPARRTTPAQPPVPAMVLLTVNGTSWREPGSAWSEP